MTKFYKCARKHGNRKNEVRGFTLAELLIVVAIIAVLVAISIPIFTSQIHKARVATDWANLRAYYAEIQADFISTGEYNDKVPYHATKPENLKREEITFLNGQKVKMQEGFFWVQEVTGKKGYTIAYYCNNKHPECVLILE